MKSVALDLTQRMVDALDFDRPVVGVARDGKPRTIGIESLTKRPHDWAVRDARCPGLSVRLTPGSKTWVVTRKAGAVKRVRKIGSASHASSPYLPAEEARKVALKWLAALAVGADPKLEQQEKRNEQAQVLLRERTTMAVALQELIDARAGKNSASTTKDRKAVQNWMAKAPLMRLSVAKVNLAAVDETLKPLLDAVNGEHPAIAWGPKRAGAGSFLKTLAYLSQAWKRSAAQQNLQQGNPFTAWRAEHKMPVIPTRTTWLDTGSHDGKAWLRALVAFRDKVDKPHLAVLIDYFLLITLWGTRATETATLRWTEVDFEQNVIRLVPEYTKSGAPGYIPMTRWARQILEARRKQHEAWRGGHPEWVFPSRQQVPRTTRKQRGPDWKEPKRQEMHIVDGRTVLKTLAAAVGLRIKAHDLRRTVATEVGEVGTLAEAQRIVFAAQALKHASSRGGTSSPITEKYLMAQAENMRPLYERREQRLREIAGLKPFPGDKKQKATPATLTEIMAQIQRLTEQAQQLTAR